MISRVEARGVGWPDGLMDNLEAAEVSLGVVGDRDRDPSNLRRLSLSGALLWDGGVAPTYPSVSWRTMKFRSPKR